MGDYITLIGLPLAYIALAIASIAAIVFPLIFMFQDLKKAKWALIGIGALAIVFLLCYAMTSGQPIKDVPIGQSKIVEASLYMFYIMLTVAILSIVYATISRYFK